MATAPNANPDLLAARRRPPSPDRAEALRKQARSARDEGWAAMTIGIAGSLIGTASIVAIAYPTIAYRGTHVCDEGVYCLGQQMLGGLILGVSTLVAVPAFGIAGWRFARARGLERDARQSFAIVPVAGFRSNGGMIGLAGRF